jgi:hypothetical protein
MSLDMTGTCRPRLLAAAAVALLGAAAVGGRAYAADDVASSKEIFRFDTFGDEKLWTDTLRLHEAIAKAVDPTTALAVGLTVDADALPPGILKTDLKSPATTVALLKHAGAALSDDKTHAPEETRMEPTYAARCVTKRYRTTPLRGLWQHPPYFHDGKAADLAAVVEHYMGALKLGLSAEQKKDLVEYLKSI